MKKVLEIDNSEGLNQVTRSSRGIVKVTPTYSQLGEKYDSSSADIGNSTKKLLNVDDTSNKLDGTQSSMKGIGFSTMD